MHKSVSFPDDCNRNECIEKNVMNYIFNYYWHGFGCICSSVVYYEDVLFQNIQDVINYYNHKKKITRNFTII